MVEMSKTSKINDAELVTKLCDAIRFGMSDNAACGAVGVHPMTFARWMKKGYDDPEAETIYGDFYLKVLRSKSEAEMRDTQAIIESGDWKSKAWLLERRNPETWANRTVVESDRTPSPEDIAALRKFSTEELEKMLESGNLNSLASKTITVEEE